MKITLKPLLPSDMEFIKHVYKSTRTKELATMRATEEQKNQFLDFQFKAQHAHYLSTFKGIKLNIINFNKNNIGRLYIWESDQEIRLVDISLLPKFRSKGIGSKLLKSIIEESNSRNKILNLHVLQTNRALKLYQRLGFQITEKKGSHYFMEHTCATKA